MLRTKPQLFYRRDRVIFFIHSPHREKREPQLVQHNKPAFESYKNRFLVVA
jgi:hypothetical protein